MPDGLVGGGEECDGDGLGNPGETTACDTDCTFAGCGDNTTNVTRGEECDDGTADSAACDYDNGISAHACTEAACGDGYANAAAGEGCDDGDQNNNDPCPDDTNNGGTCQPATCGDGHTCTSGLCTTGPTGGDEECDDGGANSDALPDACRTNCANAGCPDGVTDTGEECDDGNLINTDACNTDCTESECGDGQVDTLIGEECDNGDAFCIGGVNDGLGCANEAFCDVGTCPTGSASPGAECTPATSVAICGDGSCGTGDGTAFGSCDTTANRDDLANHCRTNCLQDHCGDGTIDSGENCDDANTDNTDACIITDLGGQPSMSPKNCRTNTCGDGFECTHSSCDGTPPLQECDNGVDNNANGACLPSCEANVCGDGFTCTLPGCTSGPTGGVEQCDNGVGDGGPDNDDNLADACRTDCATAHCGDGVTDSPENCDDGDTDNKDNCIITNPGGPVNLTAGDNPAANCKFNVCGDSFECTDASCDNSNPPTFPPMQGCDDGNLVSGDGCTLACVDESCGDGAINDVDEDCDPGAGGIPLETAGCDLDCTFQECGDDTVNMTAGEECDDGMADSADCDYDDGISAHACTLADCGDLYVNTAAGEECEQDANDDDSCVDSTCQDAECGDGVQCTDAAGSDRCELSPELDGVEGCDDGAESATCDGPGAGVEACTPASCGDSHINMTAGEECDDGTNDGGPDECKAGCFNPACGDNETDPGNGEQCDAGLGDAGCTIDCCLTGGDPDSYDDGLLGAMCQLGKVNEVCGDHSACRKASKIDKRLDKIEIRIAQSEQRAALGKISSAERKARNARRQAERTIDQLSAKLCPEPTDVRDCLIAQLELFVDVAVELEGNLAGNNQ